MDALRHVDVDARVRIVDKLRSRDSAEFIFQPVSPNEPVKFIRRTVLERLSWVVACQQADLRSA